MIPVVFKEVRRDIFACRDWKSNQDECPESERITALLDVLEFVSSQIIEVFDLHPEFKPKPYM